MAGVSVARQLEGYDKLGAALASGRFTRDALKPVGRELGKVALQQWRRQIGGSGMAYGWPRRQRRVTSKADVGNGLVVRLRPANIWGLAENGADPHLIKSRGKPGTLRIGPPGRMAYGRVRHPGMRPLGSPIKATVAEIPEVWMVEQNEQVDRYL